MSNPFFTIGHSTRSVVEFVRLLRLADVAVVVDVRTMPRSRTNPQFNRERLPDALADHGIVYEHIAELGGLRGRERRVAPSANAFWTNRSFRNYADYATGERFGGGLARLREIGQTRRCAIMCAESLWWRCHRRIIADYLLASGESVFHIMAAGRIDPARLTQAARSGPHGTLLYPDTLHATQRSTTRRSSSAV